jgi:hypothetical protein
MPSNIRASRGDHAAEVDVEGDAIERVGAFVAADRATAERETARRTGCGAATGWA